MSHRLADRDNQKHTDIETQRGGGGGFIKKSGILKAAFWPLKLDIDLWVVLGIYSVVLLPIKDIFVSLTTITIQCTALKTFRILLFVEKL